MTSLRCVGNTSSELDSANARYKTLKRLMTSGSLESYATQQFQILSERQQVRLQQSQQRSQPFSQCIAQHAMNDERNRYIDIIPFDSNRVVLSTLGPAGDDYINASWIEWQSRRYIATQGPLPSTCGDFWRMVLEQQVNVIVCLTPEMENRRVKCAAYWPVGNDTKRYRLKSRKHINHFLFPSSHGDDDWTIEVKNSQQEEHHSEAACIVRQVQVSCYKQQQLLQTSTVYQLQFLGWADHSVPQQTSHLNALVRLANQLQQTSPMVVHCSAGCGRTGTFCVVDTVTGWLKHSESKEDEWVDPVFEVTDAFRQQRTTMVQTASQYLFCYHAIWDYLQQQQLEV
ncbi:protein-tyrosine phosphatase-like protein [Halteromyces radiatus]|uniref:protein-tyrosine phosphatase-like protein n=1 Tax=Halteromyces radiatus TaxID=101107 RepID=UPI00221EC053|nr:protein-tyrosine phosphatase-like protein [Halteromyces radiatus]KAI8077740.1 protein-tyrosine phosphatase-like protein [Halteromyces radiatus]